MKQINGLPSGSKFAPVGVILLVLIFLALNAFVIVKPGHVGVVITLGAVGEKAFPEGFHVKKPFLDKIEQIDVRLMKAHEKARSASKDLQMVSTEVTLQYSLNSAVAPQIFQKIGDSLKVSTTVIEPAIQESVKAITAQYTAEQLVTQRSEVKVQIQEAIRGFIDLTTKEKSVLNAVKIANVAITDFAFSQEFDRAIELKVKAEQEALQARNEKIRRVTQAEAAAAERELAADAAAYEIRVQSEERAAAIQREAEAIKGNPELITLRAIETWDGNLPRYYGSDMPLPIFDINTLESPTAKELLKKRLGE